MLSNRHLRTRHHLVCPIFGFGFSFLPEEPAAQPQPQTPFLATLSPPFPFFSDRAHLHPQIQPLAKPGGSRNPRTVVSAIRTIFSWSFVLPSCSLFLSVPSLSPRKRAASAVKIPFRYQSRMGKRSVSENLLPSFGTLFALLMSPLLSGKNIPIKRTKSSFNNKYKAYLGDSIGTNHSE